ncbi:Tcp11-domain-containing protein [Hesseltinella vesiculosa]|uniref:Tcp11-domain-containing protein n=1 Tax=Hesseltinella vesiculosa TaxID=101127 RepID=A0A1X2G687_9FUNG|nr:Tcp11-domain-containing protein [Hesseltinella vesiculosa]
MDEVWNSFYAVRESSQQSPNDQTLVSRNLSSFYLQLARLQQILTTASCPQELMDALTQLMEKHIAPQLMQIPAAASPPLGHAVISPPPSPTLLALADASTTNVVSAEQLERMLTGYGHPGLSNEQLAHELILNPDFTLQAPPKHPLQSQVESIAKQAFFDHLDEAYRNQDYDQLLPMFEELKQRLLALAPDRSHAALDGQLDLDLVKQQMDHPPFDWHAWASTFLTAISSMVAPVRDHQVQELQQTLAASPLPGTVFRGSMELLDAMSLDLINFRLRSLRPHLLPMAVDYERTKFAQAIQHGQAGLANTRQWLQHAVAAADQQKPMTTAYLQLVTATTAWTRLTCPETVLLDMDRVVGYQNQVQTLVVVAALLLLANQFHVPQLPALADRLFQLLDNHDPPTRLTHLTSELESHVAAEQRPLVKQMVNKTLQDTDPIYKLLFKRVAAALSLYLDHAKPSQDPSLALIHGPLTKLCKRVALFSQYNEKVYSSWYKAIIGSVSSS